MRTAVIGLCKFLVILTAIATSNQAFAQSPAAKARADEIIRLAREAIGDQSKLDSLQSLSLSATTRRTFGEQQRESEIEYEMIFPDKFIRTDTSQFGTMILALNGNQVWQDFAAAQQVGGFGPPGGGGGGGRVMRFGGPGQGNSNDPAGQERFSNFQRAEFARLLLGILLISPSSFQVEFSYLGEAKSPDGTVVDAILAKGPGDFKLALYFNHQSHKLLMLNYKGRQQQFQMRRGPSGGGPGRPDGGQGGRPGGQGAGQGGGQGGGQGAGQGGGQGAGQGGGQGAGQGGGQGERRPQMTPEEREKFIKDMEARVANAPEVEFRWIFEDYKNVGGINLPHRLTKSEAGKPNEELVIHKYKINPKLSPDKFVKKETEKTPEGK